MKHPSLTDAAEDVHSQCAGRGREHGVTRFMKARHGRTPKCPRSPVAKKLGPRGAQPCFDCARRIGNLIRCKRATLHAAL